MRTIELKTFFFFYSFSGRALWLDWLIVLVGEYLLYPVLGVYAYYMYALWGSGQVPELRGYAVALVGALIARIGVSEMIHLFVRRTRPYNALRIPHLLSNTTYAFPSGHTIFLCALGTGLLWVSGVAALLVLLLGFCVGLARVMAGVHYPTDILGGAVFGALTGYAVHLYSPLFLRALGV